ncbi:PP2C protein phosphatase 2 [Cryptosporidium ubiquitum]|uniref:PP2C protein phosphatase 2 n=1 Tax=Cryptosporidium ubiquitum TaxID=857276 RepID=A0A1J4MBG6_9CRYT|nr:PP2C protein phosphatase 2 [Cryptosporidium ubiquitum]OII70811.1 PP2C protein phosphatase 2 [Cryptosporidium ubiquitum]
MKSFLKNEKCISGYATAFLAGGLSAWLYLDSRKKPESYLFGKLGKSYKVGCASQNNTSKKLHHNLINQNAKFKFEKSNYVELIGDQGPVKNGDLGPKKGLAKVSISAIQVNANNPIEDRLLIQRMKLNFPDGESKDFVISAVIDGHGGWQVAEYVQNNFLRVFQKELNQYMSSLKIEENSDKSKKTSHIDETDIIAGLLYSLKKTYYIIDEELKNKLEVAYNLGFSKLASVGACTTVSIITEDAILTANSGDCLSVYCNENGIWLPLNEQLSAMNPQEQRRLEEIHKHEKDSLIQCKQILYEKLLMGLYTIPKYKGCYIKGILQPSRAIGDFRLKSMDFNYNWEKDLSTEKLMPTFSYVLKDIGGEKSENERYGEKEDLNEDEFPYSYDLINGNKSINMRRDSSRYFVKNPLSFPYVRSEPMLHLFFYNSLNKHLSSTNNTNVEKISPNEYSLTPVQTNSSLKVECITPEYKHLPISEYSNSSEFFKDFTLSKMRNAYSYIQTPIDSSKRSYLILGTDGVWDFLTPKDVTNIILNSKSPDDGIRKILKKVLNNAGVDSVEKLKSLPKKRKVFDDTSVILAEITPNKQDNN